MQSRNPIFSRGGALGRQQSWTPSAQDLQQMYNAPAYAGPRPPLTRPMTIDDVVVRGFITLGTLVVAAAIAWVVKLPPAVGFLSMLVGFVLAMVVTFRRSMNPALILPYAVCYGVGVGVISHYYNDYYHGIVLQAVIGTTLAFAGMLTAYSLRIIKVNQRFARIVVAMGFALVALMILDLLVRFFAPSGIGIRTDSPTGWIFSVVAIVVGCLFLALDFADIETAVRQGAPERYAWHAAFGLTVTLVWIYLEILRFLSYFTRR